tara:strand:- start:439 stop:1146 length:708 start_codon:yes stop_codon:yes gene_type:complete
VIAPEPHRSALDVLSSWFDAVFADIDRMSSGFRSSLENDAETVADVASTARRRRDELKQFARQFLDGHPRADGAGLVLARSGDTLRGAIEWWGHGDASEVTRYTFGMDPTSDRFYDYEQLEWFVEPLGSRRHWVTGPYIDYLGIDDYIVSLTSPCIVGGRAIGVAGSDFKMTEFERELLPVLRQFPQRAVLLNPHGTVLVSNSARWTSGDRFDDASFAALSRTREISGTVTVAYE